MVKPSFPAFILRTATAADASPLATLYWQARCRTFPWVNPAQFAVADFSPHTQGEQIWLAQARATGVYLGFISLWAPDNFIHHLYVAPDGQRGGLGRALLALVAQQASGRLSLKVASANHPAQAFYTHLGWAASEERGVCPLTGPWQRWWAPV
ncbi:MAG: GNAT family N-acetyltransferase [Aeromonas sp.]